MATRNFNVNADARTGDTYGAGACDHLPIGTYSTETYQSWLKFATDFTSMTSITSAVLYIKTSTHYHVAPNAGTMAIRRVTGSWIEGSSSHPMDNQGSGIDGANEPTTDAGSEVTVSYGTGENTWISKDITAIVLSWAPTTVSGGGNQPNYGIRLATTNGVTEFWSREYGSSHDAYIVVTYETNTAPTAPTINSPTGGTLVASQTPSLKFVPNDPQGDVHSKYRYQVDSDPAFGSPDDDYTITGSFTNGVEVTRVVQATLARGTTYYWRVKTWDQAPLEGAWSASGQFKIMVEPSATPTSYGLANLFYNAGANTTPKVRHVWTQSCADGHAITNVELKILSSDGVTTHETINYTSGGLTKDSAYAVTNGTQYRIQIASVTCSGGVTKSYGTGNYNTQRVRWGRASYYRDLTSAPVSWGTPAVSKTTPSGTSVVVEYGSNTTSAAPGTWYSSLGSVTLNQFVFHRVTMLSNVAGTSPSLDALTINYSSSSLIADKWSVTSSTYVKIDTADQVYGTQSMRVAVQNNATYHGFSQTVTLKEDTTYTLSGRIKAAGVGAAHIKCTVGGTQYFSEVVDSSADWVPVSVTFTTGAGAGGASTVDATVGGYVGGPNSVGTPLTWFDALKLEASSVVTPWTPGFISGGVTLDAGGVQVDGQAGGIFRLRGSTGGTRDTVALNTNGLLFGPLTTGIEVYSPSDSMLVIERENTNSGATLKVNSVSGAGAIIAEGGGGNPRIGVRWTGDTADRVALDVNMEALRYTDGTTLRHELYRGFMDAERIGSYSALGDGGIPRVIVRNLDQQINNTNVLTNVTGMSFPALASTWYYVKFVIPFVVTSATTDGIQFAVTGPTGAVPWLNTVIPTSATARSFQRINALGAAASTAAIDSTTAVNIAIIEGVISTSSTAGTIQLQAASDTATTGDITLKAGMQLWIA